MVNTKKINEITDLNDFNDVIKRTDLTIVDFYAVWCGPCKRIAPFLESLNKDEDFNMVNIIKVNVDEANDIVKEYEIKSMPTFLFFKDGKKIDTLVGADKAELLRLVEKNK